MKKCSQVLVFGVLMALLACDGGPGRSGGTISPEQFIEANVALRQIDPATATAAQRRAAVLREQGVTEEQLRAFVEARSERTEELADTWEEIRRRLEAATTADTAVADSSTAPAG